MTDSTDVRLFDLRTRTSRAPDPAVLIVPSERVAAAGVPGHGLSSSSRGGLRSAGRERPIAFGDD
jgi:hypothetical protein